LALDGLMQAPRVAILYALPDEARYFNDDYEALRIVGEDPSGRAERDTGLPPLERRLGYVLCAGVGGQNAARNSRLLFQSGLSVCAVVVAGFAGGLADGMDVGSVVVADRVSDTLSQQDYYAGVELLRAASGVQLPDVLVYRGLLATTGSVLVHAAEKQEFARKTGAIAVDMESAAVAGAATEYGVPWLAVRVITDGVNDDLPLDFNALANPDGSVNRGRIVASTLLHPWKIPALLRLGMRSSRAARNLAAFLHALLLQIDNQTRCAAATFEHENT
jgi:adenosylhomocysteine nucleosidase